jgi:hypothetical protein
MIFDFNSLFSSNKNGSVKAPESTPDTSTVAAESASGLQNSAKAKPPTSNEVSLGLSEHLGRLARFGANIVDAHACIILLPEAYVAAQSNPSRNTNSANTQSKRLKLCAYHSLSDVIDQSAALPVGEGLIGWVGQHGKPVHLSPFDKDSRSLGVYRADCSIMSFIAVPFSVGKYGWGVLTCDSLKPNAFTVLHSHLLHDFASELSSVVALHNSPASTVTEQPWNSFKQDSQALINALGAKTIALMRLAPSNYHEIERAVGMSNTIDMADQLFRLFQQSLPPHFPIVRLPNGEVVIMLDRMMSSFYESKLTAVMRHVHHKGLSLQYSVTSQSLISSSATSAEGLNVGQAQQNQPQKKIVGW